MAYSSYVHLPSHTAHGLTYLMETCRVEFSKLFCTGEGCDQGGNMYTLHVEFIDKRSLVLTQYFHARDVL
jgi:hypothetical protein